MIGNFPGPYGPGYCLTALRACTQQRRSSRDRRFHLRHDRIEGRRIVDRQFR